MRRSRQFFDFQSLSGRRRCLRDGRYKIPEFFDANDKILIADIGHFEVNNSLLTCCRKFGTKFPTFAVLKQRWKPNPVRYFL